MVQWMFNEIWPTGGWGSIEYGGNTTGQVAGGRWKPIHYALRATVFADQMASCNALGACFVKNDAPIPFNGTVDMRIINAMTGKTVAMSPHLVFMGAGAGVTEWFCPVSPQSSAGKDQGDTSIEVDGRFSTGADTDTGTDTDIRSSSGDTTITITNSTTSSYVKYAGFLPVPRQGYYKVGVLPGSSLSDHSSIHRILLYCTILTCNFRSAPPPAPATTLFPRQWLTNGTQTTCEQTCNKSRSWGQGECLGFTAAGTANVSSCWLYSTANVTHLVNHQKNVFWFQKPGTKPLPVVPPPPPGGTTPPLPCVAWNGTIAWSEAGCDATGKPTLRHSLQALRLPLPSSTKGVTIVKWMYPRTLIGSIGTMRLLHVF